MKRQELLSLLASTLSDWSLLNEAALRKAGAQGWSVSRLANGTAYAKSDLEPSIYRSDWEDATRQPVQAPAETFHELADYRGERVRIIGRYRGTVIIVPVTAAYARNNEGERYYPDVKSVPAAELVPVDSRLREAMLDIGAEFGDWAKVDGIVARMLAAGYDK